MSCAWRRLIEQTLFRACIPPLLIGVVLIYNPLLYSFSANHIEQTDINAVYGRLFGICMGLETILGGVVLLFYDGMIKAQRICVIIIISLLCITSYSFDSGYKPFDIEIDHYFKMTDDAKYINDRIAKNPTILIIDSQDMKTLSQDLKTNQYQDMIYMSGMYNPDVRIIHEVVFRDEILEEHYPYVLCYDTECGDKISQMRYHLIWNDGNGCLYERE